MNSDLKNKKYWRIIPARNIIGHNALPGNELIDVLPNGSSVLDLGCGSGEMTEFLSVRGYNVTGIDLNVEAISQNKLKTKNVNYILGDITKTLPFTSKNFDAVVISFVLVNIIPQKLRKSLISELTRILKPGGYVWLNEGLVSKDYLNRYKLSKPFLDDRHSFFVFKDNFLSSLVKTPNQLTKVLNKNMIARVAHHFTISELNNLFNQYTLVYKNITQTASPNTKSIIKMITMVLRRK